MKPFGYTGPKTIFTKVLNLGERKYDIEKNDVKHPLWCASIEFFNYFMKRAEVGLFNSTALLFRSAIGHSNICAINTYTLKSCLHGAGFTACCVSIPFSYISHLR